MLGGRGEGGGGWVMDGVVEDSDHVGLTDGDVNMAINFVAHVIILDTDLCQTMGQVVAAGL